MRSIGRLRLLASEAQSVVLPVVQEEGKVFFESCTCQDSCKMLPPNNIPSAVSLLPTESKEPAKAQRLSTSNAVNHGGSGARKQDKSLKSASPLLHERGQQQAHGAAVGSRHHAVPALEAALQGAEINKIRDGAPFVLGLTYLEARQLRGFSVQEVRSLCRLGDFSHAVVPIRAQLDPRKQRYDLGAIFMLGNVCGATVQSAARASTASALAQR